MLTENDRNTLRAAVSQLSRMIADLREARQAQELRALRDLRGSVEASVLRFRGRR